MTSALLAAALVKALTYAGIFCVMLALIVLWSKMEQRAFAKPYREKAKRIGRVRCQRCAHEGSLAVKVKTQSQFTPDTPVPQAVDGLLLCENCGSQEWTPLGG